MTAATVRLADIPGVRVTTDEPLSRHTRFAIGGLADLFAETSEPEAFAAALSAARSSGLAWTVIGGGTNLIVADTGFRGVVLRYSGDRITSAGLRIVARTGAVLQDLVDYANARGLGGLETLAGIPGWVGAAVYGNAGAYGHSISERVVEVEFTDGERLLRFGNAECDFQYRESVFKDHKEWILLSVTLEMLAGDSAALERRSTEILDVRNRKFPPTMKCAGSIFKNFLSANLPAHVAAELPANAIIEGKVPAAWFLERAGAKGMERGGIRVADYHANLIYNAGGGTAAELRDLIGELKRRVREQFGIEVEEEVQYVGF